jgi:hypothetical protein
LGAFGQLHALDTPSSPYLISNSPTQCPCRPVSSTARTSRCTLIGTTEAHSSSGSSDSKSGINPRGLAAPGTVAADQKIEMVQAAGGRGRGEHARTVTVERDIALDWVDLEADNRVLRVVYNASVSPVTVVTVFFARRERRRRESHLQ